MPHVHLDLHNSTIHAKDEEGVDVADLDEARERALEGIRGFLSHELNGGKLDLRGHIDIIDDDGAKLMTVAFSEAVTVLVP